jgi:hypothetical protein
LKLYIKFNKTIQPVISSFKSIPYIGRAFAAFGGALKLLATVSQIVVDVLKIIKDFLEQIKLEARLEKILEWNDNLGTDVSQALAGLVSFEKPLVVVDMSCPEEMQSVTKATCQALSVPMSPINTGVSTTKNILSYIEDVTSVTYTIFNPLYDVALSAQFSEVQSVISDMTDVFEKMLPILTKTVSVSLPSICFDTATVRVVVRYPCGIKKCKRWGIRYPCGIKFCSASVTADLPVNPHPCTLTLSATVGEIIDGSIQICLREVFSHHSCLFSSMLQRRSLSRLCSLLLYLLPFQHSLKQIFCWL